MLTTHLDEVLDLAVRVFNAGTAVCDVDEYAFGGFVIPAFDGSTHTQHEIGCLLLHFIVECRLFLLCHFRDFRGPLEGNQTVDRSAL